MFNASMKFDLGEEVNALRDMVHAWAQKRVKPLAAGIDKDNDFPAALWREMGALGLLGITVPEEYGGAGWAILHMWLRSRKSPAPRLRSRSAMARIPTCA